MLLYIVLFIHSIGLDLQQEGIAQILIEVANCLFFKLIDK